MTSITIRNATPADAEAIYHLNYTVYGDTPETMYEDGYVPVWSLYNHIQRFPEGVFVADSGHDIVGFAITIRTSHNPDDAPLRWLDAIGGLALTHHQKNGLWLYGVDFGVDPNYRKQGVGTLLYQARFDRIRQLNLKGYYAGGMLAGYRAYHEHMSIEEYVKQVRQGLITDPTITMQLNRGFKPGEVIKNYCGTSLVNDSAMQIVWHNYSYA